MAFSIAFAWSVAQSAIVLVWFVTYLLAGLSPVPHSMEHFSAPEHGVKALDYIMRTTLANWIHWDAVANPPDSSFGGIVDHSVRTLQQLLSARGHLKYNLSRCKEMILDSHGL